ncbi:MAG: class I SAM-dependent methyltransferase [Gaiellaceae bacterium]
MTSNADAVRARFAATAALTAERADERAAGLSARVRGLLDLRGDERALDAGAGSGALAFALAPLVREAVAVDVVPELLEEGRRRGAAFPNVTFVEGDVTSLPFADGAFDVAGAAFVLHHVARPELALAELVRVTRPGGTVLVADQVAPVDPLLALELNRFERARDPSHARALSDADLRGLFDSNDLVLVREQVEEERRELGPYLDFAGCTGEARGRALDLAPARDAYTAVVGWYVARRAVGASG